MKWHMRNIRRAREAATHEQANQSWQEMIRRNSEKNNGVPLPWIVEAYEAWVAEFLSARVYFIQETETGAIKIGTTKELQKRLQGLRSSNPNELKLIATISGDSRVERALHHRFDRAHIRGEWFRPVPELLAYISEIK